MIDSIGLHLLPLVRDFKWVCAGSMSELRSLSVSQTHTHTHVKGEREREKASHGFALKSPYFTVLDRQTHILSHYTTDAGNKNIII